MASSTKLVPNNSKGTLLDFGCGKGAMLSRLLLTKPRLKVHGLDISKTALQTIKRLIPKGKFILIKEGKRLPYKNDMFDFILATDVLEHILDTEWAFEELTRVLAPGGRILMTVPYHGMVKNILCTFIAFDQYFEPSQAHIRFYTKRNLKSYVRRYRLEILKFGYYGRFYPLSNGMYALCKKNTV